MIEEACDDAVQISLGFFLVLVGCKKSNVESSGSQSITPRGDVVGKWMASVSVGGGIEKSATEALSSTLKDVFLKEQGGGYKLAFDLADTSGWSANKADVVSSFAKLKTEIAKFKSDQPSASTMIVLSITGHGFSKDVFVNSSSGYSLQVGPSESDYFTGSELANVISSLKADEVVVFVQSCNSGSLSNLEVMNKYAEVLRAESSRRNLNIAVITPVSSVLFSPLYKIEEKIGRAFSALKSDQGDFGTYAQFKDQLVREVCADASFYPRSQIKNLSAVQAMFIDDPTQLGKIDPNLQSYMGVETLMGIDPQFYEYIDPNLPLVLTDKGLAKYRNNSIEFPMRLAHSSNVPVSSETAQFCVQQSAKNKEKFDSFEQIRVQILKYVQN